MQIGLLIYGSLDTISGGYLYDRRLVEHLRAQGDEVEIVSLAWRNYGRHLFDNYSRSLLTSLCERNFDMLLQDELNHPSLFALNKRLKAQVNYPIVSIVHHLRVMERHPRWLLPLYRWVEKRYLDSADAFIYNSETTHQTVEQLSPAPRPHVVATPAGNRFVQSEQLPRSSKDLRILFVGNIIERKGLHILLAAMDSLFQLRVVGQRHTKSRYFHTIRKLIDAKGLQQQVHFLGSLSASQLAEQFGWADVLVVPSTYEGFGIVYLEALGMGVPAIGTMAGAAREIIAHNENGFLIEPDDVEQLRRLLLRLQANRELLREMQAKARTSFGRFPTWEESMSQVRDFLTQL